MMNGSSSNGPGSRTVGYGEGVATSGPNPAVLSSPQTGATLGYGAAHAAIPAPAAPAVSPALDATMAADDGGLSTAGTLAADVGVGVSARGTVAGATLGAKTGTVLPGVEGDGAEIRLVPRNKSRYAEVKKLGLI